MRKPVLAYIPAAASNNTVHAAHPLGTILSTTRASKATRVNKDGLIEEVPSGMPRQDWLDGDCPSLLLEPQRINLQVYSEQFDNSSVWSRSRGTATADQQIAPNGEYTADKILGDGTGTTYFYDGISFTSGLEYVISIFVKPINVTTFTIQNFTEFGTATFDIQNGTLSGVSGSLISQDIQNYGNGWYRCSAIYDCTSTGSKNIGYGIQSYDGDQYYLWGAQVEQGSYPTSYIKTEASTVTREKDSATSWGNSSMFNITEGSWFLDSTPFENSSAQREIYIHDGTNNNRIVIQFQSNNTQVRYLVASGGSVGVSLYETITINERTKILVTFKDNDFKIYINGNLEGTDTVGNVPTGLNQFSFANISGQFNFEGKVHDTRIYDYVLSEEEAIKLTS